MFFALLLPAAAAAAAATAAPAAPCSHPRLRAFFDHALDRDRDGRLSLTELHLLRSVTSHSATTPLWTTGAEVLLAGADADTDGSLDLEEFCSTLGPSSSPGQLGEAALDGQVHLALTGVAGEARVSWVTHAACRAGSTAVDVSIGGLKYPTVAASTTNYTVPRRYWDPTGSGGFVHSAVIAGLPPATTVTYTAHSADGTP
jgi:hypothetical protein